MTGVTTTTALIRFGWLLAILAFSTGAHAQQATLVVHNNTSATLTVWAVNIYDGTVKSGEYEVAPESIGELRVPMK